MRLFYPHIFAAVMTTSFANLGAYAGHWFLEPFSLDPTYPLFWWGLFCIWLIAMCVIGWVAGVRALEYCNLSRLLAPATSANVLQDSFLATVDWILQRTIITGEFFLKHIQNSNGCRGRHRVIIAVLSKQLNLTWEGARVMLYNNHVTACLGTSWKDYFWPGW